MRLAALLDGIPCELIVFFFKWTMLLFFNLIQYVGIEP